METKKWHQQTPTIIALLIFVFPVGLYLMWKHTTWNKFIKLGITSIWALFLYAGMTGDNTKTTELSRTATITSSSSSVQPTAIPKPTKVPQSTVVPAEDMKPYKVMGFNKLGSAVYIVLSDKAVLDKEHILKYYNDISKQVCTKQCNVDFYINEDGYKLAQAYDMLQDSFIKNNVSTKEQLAMLKEWDKKNYITRANSNIAFVEYSYPNEFSLYPLKDSKYKELMNQ